MRVFTVMPTHHSIFVQSFEQLNFMHTSVPYNFTFIFTFNDVKAVARDPIKIAVVIRPTIIQIIEKILVSIRPAVISPYLENKRKHVVFYVCQS